MADPTVGGEEAFAYFLTTKIPDTINALIKLGTVAHGHGLRRIEDGAGHILDRLLADVNRVAVQMTTLSEAEITKRILDTRSRNRPSSGGLMESHIRSEPGPLGLVRVGLISELDKIVNPNGWGPFWRAQEFGTGQDEGGVPTQVGRPLYGTFEPSGEPPRLAQRGLGVGTDLAFIPGGSNPGLGRISVDLPGRHFLRDGAVEAANRYRQAMGDVQAKYLAELQRLMTELPRVGRPTRFRGTIEA